MQIHNVTQGSDEWSRLRAAHYTASEASAMMGASRYTSRAELLRQKATGAEPEYSEQQLRVMRRGHEFEEAARPIAEEIIGEELYPATVTEDVEELPLLASVDGMDMVGDVLWEHKSYREDLAEEVSAGRVPEEHVWQLEQQILVTGASRVLFMVSDGTRERCAWCWYDPDPERGQRLIRSWWQFHADLAEYEPPKDEGPAPAGSAPEQLPALRVEVRGEVTASNIDEFKSHAQAVIEGINTDLHTDEDFASAEKTVKWAKEVEKRLDSAKEQALSQTEDLDRLFRTMDEIRELARGKRLELEKLVKHRKEAVRDEIRVKAVEAIRSHYDSINADLPDGIALGVPADVNHTIAAAMKGKKTVQTLKDAADQAVADAKLAANELADRVRSNASRLNELAGDHSTLFPDRTSLVMKAPEDMDATVKARIAEHQEQERRRQEAERERIRQEEARKAEQQEAAQAADEQSAGTRLAVGAETDAKAAVEQTAAATHGDDEPGEPAAATEPADDGALMTLGDIQDAIAPLSISAAGLSELGIEPVGREKAAKLYRAADFSQICEVLAQHLLTAATGGRHVREPGEGQAA